MSSRSLNKVQLIGNLTRDPELRYTPQGTPVCTIGLATNRSWVDSNNQRQEETEYHRLVAWNKLAELCSQLLFKGRKIYIEGRLQTRNWTTQDGQERQTTEVVIDDMIILDNRHKEGEEAGNEMPAHQAPVVTPVVSDPVTVTDDVTSTTPTTDVADTTETAAASEEPVATPEVTPADTKDATKDTAKKSNKATEDIDVDDIPF